MEVTRLRKTSKTFNCEKHTEYTTASVGHQVGEIRGLVWFSHWFVCPAYYEYWYRPRPENGVVWHRLYERITLTYPDGREYLWLLKDEFDRHACQLGVWPD